MSMFNLCNLFTSASHSRSHLKHCISIRWKRRPKKPSWLGMAKSKMFTIPEKKELPELEKTELDRLRNIYDRQFSSLTQFMVENARSEAGDASAEITKENIKISNILIDEWNAKSALLREERLQKEKLEQEEAALKNIIMDAEKTKYIEAKVEQIVTAEIAASKTFVTRENLDKVLDECLNSIQDYNFALDLKGHIYKGESTVPVGKLKPTNVNQMISGLKKSDSKDPQSQKNLK